MKKSLYFAIAFGFTAAAFAATIPAPPPTPTDNVVDVIHGVKVADRYRWLENWSDPKVRAWSAAQNARTRTYLDALPSEKPIREELKRLISATSPSFYRLEAHGSRVFAMYADPKLQQPMLVTLDAAADPKSRKAIVDPNALDPTGHIEIDWFVPSHDGTKLAVSLSKNGSEVGTLHVYDVATGKEIGTPIPRVQYPTAGGSLAWAADDKGFWYTRYPGPPTLEADQRFHMQVYFHALGSDAAKDTLELGTKDGLEKVSEVFLDNRCALPTVMAMVQRGDGNTWSYYVLQKGKPPVRVGTYSDDVVYATFGPDGAIYGISRKNSSNGRIVKLEKPVAGGLATAKVIVPQSDVAIMSGGAEGDTPDLTFTRDKMFVRDIVGGPTEVRVFGLDGKPEGKLPLPDISANSWIAPLNDGRVLYNVMTYLRPVYFDAWNPATGKVQETDLKVVSPISYADAEVTRVFATSKDGTKIPVNIIMKKGTKLDGGTPALLYGYGGFGISMTPGFLGAFHRVWLDAGGIYAIANIRGGAEYGERWHQEGMLTHKQNDFDDFAAAAQYLIDHRYTSHRKLALMGGSNGGLLMGAVLTQHPGLARAVVSAVGLYDMVRFATDPNGAFNTTEYGSISDPAQFKALYAYSPYHHVTPKMAYPAVLMLTGATDGRVNPMHSRKFTAALQAATVSGHPILLRTSMKSGHGIGSSLSERIAEMSDELSFLFDQIGMTWKAGGENAR
ncbi:MAG: S9 family peptidase [Alphaproteobacteria bacterium]|nr:prolyl oligopeptidase family serine peptidase [Alphaproteobacteria bacterium]MDE2111356.1 S9 family peptidase [Alphaproteobacteria bacterium]